MVVRVAQPLSVRNGVMASADLSRRRNIPAAVGTHHCTLSAELGVRLWYPPISDVIEISVRNPLTP